MTSIKERLDKMKKEIKERSKQLLIKDQTLEFQRSLHTSEIGTDTKMLVSVPLNCSSNNDQKSSVHRCSSLARNSSHSLEQSTSKYYSNSCSKLTVLMESPVNNIVKSVPTKLGKSISNGNIYCNDGVLQNGAGGDKISSRKLVVRGKYYTILNKIGRGGTSVVFQAFSISDGECVAVKCVDLTKADNTVRSAYENEIKLLETLQGSPYVIKMYNYEKRNNKLYVVMERGDIDLATFMQKKSIKIDAKFIKYHWQEMLRCVKVIHERNIVHSDLKPANFLFVGATLKLIDFGIASNIPTNKTSVMKDVQIGTVNYMSPEAINGSYTNEDGLQLYKIPLKSDVWSLGCILYAMVYGKTPFQHLSNQLAKLQAIASENVLIDFPPIKDKLLLNVLKRCLVKNVEQRATIDELLNHPYLKE